MKALILVDIQNDFLPGGALAVRHGDQILPLVKALMGHFDLIVATQDWHPAEHKSFASNHAGTAVGDIITLQNLDQVLWPDHCVQGTAGAEFSKEIDTGSIEKVFQKGTDIEIDSYSGFFDNGHLKDTGLGDYLKSKGVTQVFLVGLATDYCVKFTALDAQALGFDTTVITDAVRAVNIKPDDGALALAEMAGLGIHLTTSDEILKNES